MLGFIGNKRWAIEEVDFIFKTVKNEIAIIINDIGNKPVCNSRADRAPHIFGFCFPLCWRCTATAIGMWVVAPIIFAIFTFSAVTKTQAIIIVVLLLIPILVDGGNQYYFQRKESNNLKRFVTGILAGIALYLLSMILKAFLR